jgi:hypothetical protein
LSPFFLVQGQGKQTSDVWSHLLLSCCSCITASQQDCESADKLIHISMKSYGSRKGLTFRATGSINFKPLSLARSYQCFFAWLTLLPWRSEQQFPTKCW